MSTVQVRISGPLGIEEAEQLTAELEKAVDQSTWRATAEPPPPGSLSGETASMLVGSVFDGTVGVIVNAVIVGAVHEVLKRWQGHHLAPEEHTYEVRVGDWVVIRDGRVVSVIPREDEVIEVGPQAATSDDADA